MKKNYESFPYGLMIFLLFSSCNPKETCQDVFQGIKPTMEEVKVTRYGSVIRLKPEKYDMYRELHANPWPGVDSLLKVCNIRNYSIYYRDGYLFSYLEYTGINWEADMAKLAEEPIIQEWWKLTDPCQEPVESAAEGEWWAPMEELYHLD